MKKVTATDVRDWMDKQIEGTKLIAEVLRIDDTTYDHLSNLTVSSQNEIHVGGVSVRFIADIMDLDLCVKARKNDDTNPYEVFVLYNGYSFFGIETEEEYEERGAVV